MLGSFRITFAGLLLSALSVLAADGPIRLPVAPPVPQPMPAPPEPGGVLRLAAGEWYAVESDVELVPLCHPRGLVKFAKKKPGTFLGKFAGGNGTIEERDLKGPFVYLGTASGVGRAELFFVPLGLKSEADIAFAVIDVDAGEGPCPPPKPKPDPKPDDSVTKAKNVVVVVCENTVERTVAQAAAINDPAFRKFDVELVSSKDPVFTENGYKRYAEKVGFPAALVFDADATGPSDPLVVFKLSDKPSENVAQIRKVVK